MAARKKAKILKGLLFLLVLYLGWLGYRGLRYGKYLPDPANKDPLEVAGVYHLHSKDSDGTRTAESIARIAARQGADFIILTDHGSPNPAFLTQRRRQDGLLVLAGSELSVNRGHLVALAFQEPTSHFSQTAEAAAREVTAQGGFTVIAHPYSKVRWSWGEYAGYSGVEILSADAMLRRNWLRLLPSLPLILLAPRVPLLSMLSYPEKNFKRWDDLCRHHPVYAYFSCDAHLLYSSLLSVFYLHVLLPRPLPQEYREASALISRSLRQGRFYNCVHAAAPGYGFRFWGQSPSSRIPMGAATEFSPDIQLHVQLPGNIQAECRLLLDGRLLLTSREPRFQHRPPQAGTYRIEVYLRQKSPLRETCPWIVSNPIFLREPRP